MEQLHLFATLTNSHGQTTRLRLRAPNIAGGIWVCNERSRMDAFRRLGLETSPLANPTVHTSHTFRAVDWDGWHTYTLYAEK